MEGFAKRASQFLKEELGTGLQTAVDLANDVKTIWAELLTIGERISKTEKRLSGLEKESASWDARRTELAALKSKVADLEVLVKERGNAKTHSKRKVG